jgi:hypothetical protein
MTEYEKLIKENATIFPSPDIIKLNQHKHQMLESLYLLISSGFTPEEIESCLYSNNHMTFIAGE